MHKSIIQLLTGRASEFSMFPEFNTFSQDLKEDDTIRSVRKILGTEDEYWAYCVYQICRANPDISYGPINDADNVILDGRRIDLVCNEKLVSDECGAALVRPISDEIQTTTLDRQAVAKYDPLTHTMLIAFAGTVWAASCHYAKDRIFVSWPEELGIRGALLAPDEVQTFILNLRLYYPTKVVVEEAKSSDLIYQMLETFELTHAFFFADSNEEALAVLVRALQLYSDKLNS